jgi:hypothetical protein
MNFDLGNILTKSWEIPWKHKSIWGLLALPIVIAFLPFLLFLVFFLILLGLTDGNIPDFIYTGLALIFMLTFLISILVNHAVRTAAMSAATLGIIRADRGEGSTTFMDLLKDGMPYFWRVLGVIMVIGLTISMAFTIFFMLVFVLTLVTFGMASICLQPIMLLLTPLMFLVAGVTEAAQMAVIVEDMSIMDAIKHAVQVVRAHIWKYVIITMIVYVGGSILSTIIFVPLTLPVMVIPFVMALGQEMSMQSVALICVLFFGIFFPVMMLVSSVLGVYMKTSLDITYLRLAKPVGK